MGNKGHILPKTDHPILVTGASGYISSYVIRTLLAEGYKVRGTVRSLSNKQKIAHLEKFHNFANLTLVEADLSNDDCWNEVVNGCEYVVHVASPIPPYVPKDEDEIIKPAVEGAKSVLKASIKHKVKRFVFTSSCLTLFFGNEEKVIDEGFWGDPSKCAFYPKSKILAQKAVWELYNSQNLQHYHTQVVAVLPSLVLGPGFTAHGNSSEALVAQIMRGNYPGIPQPEMGMSMVDVRDAADGHCLALFCPDIDGQRIAISGHQTTMTQIINTLHISFPDSPIKTNPVTVEEIKASNNPVAMRNLGMVGKNFRVDNSKGINVLGMKYLTMNETLVDMGKQLKKLAIVP